MEKGFITDQVYEIILYKDSEEDSKLLIPQVKYTREGDDLFYSTDLVDPEKDQCGRWVAELEAILSGYTEYPNHHFAVRQFNIDPGSLSAFQQIHLLSGEILTKTISKSASGGIIWATPECDRSTIEVACMMQREIDSNGNSLNVNRVLSIERGKVE